MNLALGFFDGVHLGHQAVIKAAVEHGKTTVVTFIDHPFCYLYNLKPKYILSRQQRREHIKALGADMVELDFANVAQLNAGQYLDFLQQEFSPNAIFTGHNHTFGKDKAGAEFLRAHFENYFEIAPVTLNNEIISSTKIRTALTQGDIEAANAMLGYNFAIEGEVIEGQKLGRQLGFATANVIYPDELIEIPYGVYEAKVAKYKAAANFGVRPTVNDAGQKPSRALNGLAPATPPTNALCALLEIHILDFNKDLYGQTINIEFLKMLRPERKFGSLDELKAQIQKDISLITSP